MAYLYSGTCVVPAGPWGVCFSLWDVLGASLGVPLESRVLVCTATAAESGNPDRKVRGEADAAGATMVRRCMGGWFCFALFGNQGRLRLSSKNYMKPINFVRK